VRLVGGQDRQLHWRPVPPPAPSIRKRRAAGKAALAVAHTLIVIVWYVLHDQGEYRELGHDYFT
jgi:hypothetical protein